jgi:hypothetical protein
MSDDPLDDLVRDSRTNDSRRDKKRADARRACEALKKQDIAYEALRNSCLDLLEKKLGHPPSLDGYLLDLAQRVTDLHAALTDESRARLKERMNALDCPERLAYELLLHKYKTTDVFEKLKKASQSQSLFDSIQTWLRFGPEDVLG